MGVQAIVPKHDGNVAENKKLIYETGIGRMAFWNLARKYHWKQWSLMLWKEEEETAFNQTRRTGNKRKDAEVQRQNATRTAWTISNIETPTAGAHPHRWNNSMGCALLSTTKMVSQISFSLRGGKGLSRSTEKRLMTLTLHGRWEKRLWHWGRQINRTLPWVFPAKQWNTELQKGRQGVSIEGQYWNWLSSVSFNGSYWTSETITLLQRNPDVRVPELGHVWSD